VSDFDSTLGELHGTLAAIQSVLDAHPNIAREVTKAVEDADAVAQAESEAQDQARANALARTLEATIGHIAPTKQATPVDPDAATKSPSA
jgi:hypothetical protein